LFILAKLAWLYEVIRIAGAVYRLSRRKDARRVEKTDAANRGRCAVRQERRAGISTRSVGRTYQPESGGVFRQPFITVLPAHALLWVHGATLIIVTAVSLTWFSAMAILFSTERVQVGYARIRKPIDAVMGTVLLGLGAKLALDR
jgi:threonine/homoserine/homoserine lactone efflux protein